MRKIFLSLLICLTMSLAANFLAYSEETQIGDTVIEYSLRETSQGTMVELMENDYKFILTTALSEKKRADLWHSRYLQLLEDTVFKQSYDKALNVIKEQEGVIKEQSVKIDFFQGTTVILGSTSIIMALYILAR